MRNRHFSHLVIHLRVFRKMISEIIRTLQRIPGYTNHAIVSISANWNRSYTSYFFSNGLASTGAFPSFGSGKWLTLGKSLTAAAGASSSLLSLMISGSWGTSRFCCVADVDPTGLRLILSPKIESLSLSSLMDDALLACAEASSTVRRSFSSRVSRPRLWQYQNTNRSTASC